MNTFDFRNDGAPFLRVEDLVFQAAPGGTAMMTSHVRLIALAGVASLALAMSPGYAQDAGVGGGMGSKKVSFQDFSITPDLSITSRQGGRVVATTRSNGNGRFQFAAQPGPDLPQTRTVTLMLRYAFVLTGPS